MGYPSDETFRQAHSNPWPVNHFDYRAEVIRTCPGLGTDSEASKLSLGGLGIAGEAGEVADLIKKFLHHGKPVDREKLIKEMGDVRWYLEYLAITIGVTMDEIERANAAKTHARYPEGFSHAAANARVDEKKEASEGDRFIGLTLDELEKRVSEESPKVTSGGSDDKR